jgi:hypothetical protein
VGIFNTVFAETGLFLFYIGRAPRDKGVKPMIEPKTIIVSDADGSNSLQFSTYDEADSYFNSLAKTRKELGSAARLRTIIVFEDLYVWSSFISVTGEDGQNQHFLQKAIRSEWEFNAGIRPQWWPSSVEADRMWWVHYREDRDNGRAELARVRLERYDLRPIVISPLPLREISDRNYPHGEEMSALPEPQAPSTI